MSRFSPPPPFRLSPNGFGFRLLLAGLLLRSYSPLLARLGRCTSTSIYTTVYFTHSATPCHIRLFFITHPVLISFSSRLIPRRSAPTFVMQMNSQQRSHSQAAPPSPSALQEMSGWRQLFATCSDNKARLVEQSLCKDDVLKWVRNDIIQIEGEQKRRRRREIDSPDD